MLRVISTNCFGLGCSPTDNAQRIEGTVKVATAEGDLPHRSLEPREKVPGILLVIHKGACLRPTIAAQ